MTDIMHTDEGITHYEYDGNGHITYGCLPREVSPDGFTVCHEYDGNHDLVRTWDSEGRETQNRYDAEHNLLLQGKR